MNKLLLIIIAVMSLTTGICGAADKTPPLDLGRFIGLTPDDGLEKATALFGTPSSKPSAKKYAYFGGKLETLANDSGKIYAIGVYDASVIKKLKKLGIEDPLLQYFGMNTDQLRKNLGEPSEKDFLYAAMLADGRVGKLQFVCEDNGKCVKMMMFWHELPKSAPPAAAAAPAAPVQAAPAPAQAAPAAKPAQYTAQNPSPLAGAAQQMTEDYMNSSEYTQASTEDAPKTAEQREANALYIQEDLDAHRVVYEYTGAACVKKTYKSVKEQDIPALNAKYNAHCMLEDREDPLTEQHEYRVDCSPDMPLKGAYYTDQKVCAELVKNPPDAYFNYLPAWRCRRWGGSGFIVESDGEVDFCFSTEIGVPEAFKYEITIYEPPGPAKKNPKKVYLNSARMKRLYEDYELAGDAKVVYLSD